MAFRQPVLASPSSLTELAGNAFPPRGPCSALPCLVRPGPVNPRDPIPRAGGSAEALGRRVKTACALQGGSMAGGTGPGLLSLTLGRESCLSC